MFQTGGLFFSIAIIIAGHTTLLFSLDLDVLPPSATHIFMTVVNLSERERE